MLRSATFSTSSPTKSSPSLGCLLIGGTVAGLATLGLGAAPANALSTPCGFGASAVPACQLNVPYDSTLPSDKQLTVLQGPTVGDGDIEFEWIPVTPGPGYLDDIWKVDVDFTPALSAPANGVFDYKIDISQGGLTFQNVELAVAAVAGTPTVTKGIYSDSSFTNLLQQTTISGSGSSGFLQLPSGYQTLYVRDSYVLDDGDILDNFQNNYTQNVPGPLPVLGAGAAFGFSRRLRRRVRQRHSLG